MRRQFLLEYCSSPSTFEFRCFIFSSFCLICFSSLLLVLDCLARSEVPNLGYICLPEGVHLRLSTEGKICLHIIYFQKFYIYQLILLSKVITCFEYTKCHYMLIVEYGYE